MPHVFQRSAQVRPKVSSGPKIEPLQARWQAPSLAQSGTGLVTREKIAAALPTKAWNPPSRQGTFPVQRKTEVSGTPVIQRFADYSEAQEWLDGVKPIYTANPVRQARLQRLIDDMQEGIDGWKDYGDAWEEGVKEQQETLKKHYQTSLVLERMADSIRAQVNKQTTEITKTTEVMGISKNASWLRSYADANNTNSLNTIRDAYGPAQQAHTNYRALLQAELTRVENITDMAKVRHDSNANNVENLSTINQNLSAAKQTAPIPNYDKKLRGTALNLETTLEAEAKTWIKNTLDAARTDANKKLDLPSAQVEEVRDAMIAGKKTKTQVNAIISNALDRQHKVPKHKWLTKVLGLQKYDGGVYMRAINNFDGHTAHKTRYERDITDEPKVTSSADNLYKDILGSDVTGFHITVDTNEPSYNQPHCYRGGPTLDRWDKYPQGGSAYSNRGELRNALEAARDAVVASAENAIDGKRTDKGEDLQRGAVKDILKG